MVVGVGVERGQVMLGEVEVGPKRVVESTWWNLDLDRLKFKPSGKLSAKLCNVVKRGGQILLYLSRTATFCCLSAFLATSCLRYHVSRSYIYPPADRWTEARFSSMQERQKPVVGSEGYLNSGNGWACKIGSN